MWIIHVIGEINPDLLFWLCMTEAKIEHSRLAIASWVMSFVPAVLFVGIDRLVIYLISKQPPAADEVGYAFGMAVLAVLTVLSEMAALGLGIAGALQRQRKRLFAFLGAACAVLVLAVINSQVGLVDLARFFAAFFMEDQPKVYGVSPGNE
jgi:hypothetical protein